MLPSHFARTHAQRGRPEASPDATRVTIDTYVAVARELGLNAGRFEADTTSTEVRSLNKADQAEATRVGASRALVLILVDDQSHNALTSLENFRDAVRLVAS